jgi:hypothetical protein
VTEQVDSLESHVGYIELSLDRDLDGEYRQRFAGRGEAPLPHFVRAYLLSRKLPALDGEAHARALAEALGELQQATRGLKQKSEVQALHGALLHERFLRERQRADAEEANIHYLLALDLAHENPRYRAMILEQLGLLQEAVGNHRIALDHFESRQELPFVDETAALGHQLAQARALFHVEREADAAAAAEAALDRIAKSAALAGYLPLALDRAALYHLAAGQFARAVALYAQAAPLLASAVGVTGKHNRLVNRLGHAAALLGAGRPADALDDLGAVDAWLADASEMPALRWPHATDDDVRTTYRLLALGLRARALRELERLPESESALARRRDLLAARLQRTDLDEDVAALALAEAQLAEVARARHALPAAVAHVGEGLARAEAFARRTGTPLYDAQLDLLAFACELHLRDGAALRDFAFDLRGKLQAAYALLVQRRGPSARAAQRRFAAYLTLLQIE